MQILIFLTFHNQERSHNREDAHYRVIMTRQQDNVYTMSALSISISTLTDGVLKMGAFKELCVIQIKQI